MPSELHSVETPVENLQQLADLTQDWPATPSMERLAQAALTLGDIKTALRRPNDNHPYGERPGTIEIPDEGGRVHLLDTTHEDTIWPSDPHQADASALHDCHQANRFNHAALDLMARLDLSEYRGGPDGARKLPAFTPGQWYSVAVAQFLIAMSTYGESENTIRIA